MSQAIRIHETGGPDALVLEEIEPGQPAEGEILLHQTAIGLNFIDIYHRSGLYKLPSYPHGLGLEAAGVVEAVGEGVTRFKPGDRVAYCGGPPGAYAGQRVIPARLAVRIPEGISDQVAAASLLKGLTAHFLLTKTFPVQKGDTVLIHAAAGGVGLIACQLAKHLGATVIGTVGSDKKARLARENGCDHAIVYTREKIVPRVREITGGKGVEVVYDSVGKNTFMDSLDALKKFGMMVSFGNASGPVPAIEPLLLSQKGSLYLTRPTLMHHIEDPIAYAAHAAELFQMIGQGIIKITIGGTYKLADVKRAHMDLEARKTTGALVLHP